MQKASQIVNRILSSDEATRDKIRKEQLTVAAQLQNTKQGSTSKNLEDNYQQVGVDNQCMDDSMMTPYGPPSPMAYIIPVPNDIVGLIIGKGGDTIRQLQAESGAKI